MNKLIILLALILAFSAGKAFSCDMKNMQMMDHSKMTQSVPAKIEKAKTTDHSKHKQGSKINKKS